MKCEVCDKYDAIEKIKLMKKKDLIPKEKGFLYTRCRVRDRGNRYEL